MHIHILMALTSVIVGISSLVGVYKKSYAAAPTTTIDCKYLGESIYRCENAEFLCIKLGSQGTSINCKFKS